ncbi:aspartate/glutamate racemase family protein [Sagittula sp. S175]|uniref:aspartate/glutamate racemase family protein n=1 Tax=Sagittula sp. S175 TaxID=3415129 RepID=UPI003C7B5E45
MTIYVINPNSTASMTEAMLAAARATLPDVAMAGWTSHDGPPAIQGPEDGALAGPPLLKRVKDAADAGASGIVIGCFDDTALAEAQRAVSCPVIGIGQAAFHMAAMRGWRFSVVTTLAVSVPVIEENIRAYGLEGFCGKVRASEIPVLALEADPNAACTRILAEAQVALAEDKVDAIVLGCAGMVHVTRTLRTALDVPVIDPVEAAVGAMRWLA